MFVHHDSGRLHPALPCTAGQVRQYQAGSERGGSRSMQSDSDGGPYVTTCSRSIHSNLVWAWSTTRSVKSIKTFHLAKQLNSAATILYQFKEVALKIAPNSRRFNYIDPISCTSDLVKQFMYRPNRVGKLSPCILSNRPPLGLVSILRLLKGFMGNLERNKPWRS